MFVTTPMCGAKRSTVYTLFGIALLLIGSTVAPSALAQTITGTVYRDYNANASQDTHELGVEGITVAAVDAAGTTYGPTTTAADGTYTLNVPNGTEVRVEFSGLPTYLKSGPGGGGSATSVAFATSPGTVNFGVGNPAQYCDANPDMATACYVNGDPLSTTPSPQHPGPLDAVVSFPYSASGKWNGGPAPMPTHLARADSVGSIWGLAYQRSSQTLFMASMVKRHVGMGRLGTGGIYKVDYSNPGAVEAEPFIDLTTIGIPTGADPRAVTNDLPNEYDEPSHDTEAYDAVGRRALGDIDMGEDDSTLYVVNLFNKTLYAINIGSDASVPTASDVTAYPVNDPGCANGDYVVWGVEENDGEVYVGLVCTAESMPFTTTAEQNAARAAMRAHVMQLSGATFTSILDFPLDYDRGRIAGCCGNPQAEWQPWTSDWVTVASSNATRSYPQAALSDIEFDVDGSLILSFIDRHGHQTGRYNHQPDVNDSAVNYEGMSGGDLLRACKVGGSYQLESDGKCPAGSGATTGASNNQGPGGGEYYYEDLYSTLHDEITVGGIALWLGSGEVGSTVYDPLDVRSGGIVWFDNTQGDDSDRYEVYFRDMNGTLGKAAGLGDLELVCSAAPIQIGNRVWIDTDGDGIQDAGEAGVAGVTVSLYTSGGVLITSTTTDADGLYYFNVNPNTDYQIRLDNTADFQSGGPLANYNPTLANQGGNDAIDSDGVDVGGGTIGTNVSTAGPGANDHTFDFGFTILPDLELTKQVDNPAPNVGDLVEYTVEVRNTGNTSASGITVTDTLPAGLSFDSFVQQPGGATHNAGVITWTPPGLSYPGCPSATCGPSSYQLIYKARVDQQGTLENCAEVTAADQGDPDSTPNNGLTTEDDHACATVTSNNSSGGGGNGAGVESDGGMALKLAQRLYDRRMDAQAKRMLRAAPSPVVMDASSFAFTEAGKQTSSLDLGQLVPQVGPQAAPAFVVTPTDILSITNATSVFATDYIRTDGRRLGAIFSATSPSHQLYDHAKATCDRLGGGRLDDVRLVTVNEQPFVMSRLVHADGELDYSISFVIFEQNGEFFVDSHFSQDEYSVPAGATDIYNFQVWSVGPAFTQELVAGIIENLQTQGPVTFLNTGDQSPQVPDVYVVDGTYERGELTLRVFNQAGAGSLTISGLASVTEWQAQQGQTEAFEYTVTLPAAAEGETTVSVTVETGYLYDAAFSVQHKASGSSDRLYYADGTWGFSAGTGSSIASFSTFEEERDPQTTDYLVERNAFISGDVTTWASLFRFMRPSGQPVDVSAYDAIEFTASGFGRVNLVVEKASITDANQYATNFQLTTQPTTYRISFADLRLATGATGFTGEDVNMLTFYALGNTRTATPYSLVVEDVRFTGRTSVATEDEELPTGYALEQNYPNPFNPQTTIRFSVPTATEAHVVVFDLLGREVMTLLDGFVEAGAHEVVFDAAGLPSGTYLYRLKTPAQTISRTMTLLK